VSANKKTVFSVLIAAPPQTVWDRLTTPGVVQPFYFNSILEADLRPGGDLSYLSTNRKVTFIKGQILEVTAPSRLVHTFRFNDLSDEPSTVTFELTPEADGTRLTVTHEGSEATAKTFGRVERGWRSILTNLQVWMETGKLPFKSRVQNVVMGLMLPFMPKNKSGPK